MIEVDGSYGEGGGQILRTSVALSALTQRPITIKRIRARRENPGLRPQHLNAIRAVAQLCDAEVEGLSVGSSSITFKPGSLKARDLKLDMGTAGSITLLLQAAIPVAASSKGEVKLEVRGGTDVKWSPTLDYFRYVVLPAYSLLGIEVSMEVVKRGYYPQGGGLVNLRIKGRALRPVDLTEAQAGGVSIYSSCGSLSKEVAERQARSAKEYLEARGVMVEKVLAALEPSPSPGSSLTVCSVQEGGAYVGSDALGERGKRAEKVGEEAAGKFLKEVGSGAPVDSHLADMLVVPLVMAPGPSRYKASWATEHLRTNLHVAKLLTGRPYSLDEGRDGTVLVRIGQ